MGGPLGAGIGKKEDAGALKGPGGAVAGPDEPIEVPAVVAGETDDMLLAGHGIEPFW